MSLKRDIIIVNEFTMKLKSGKGTRGATPGRFIIRYMARPDATDKLTPIRQDDSQDLFARFDARDALEERSDNLPDFKSDVANVDPLAGVAFGVWDINRSQDVSMSRSAVYSLADKTQRLFDDNHTVMKTVLSFDPEYLFRHGIISDDFHPTDRHLSPDGSRPLTYDEELDVEEHGYRGVTKFYVDENNQPINDEKGRPLFQVIGDDKGQKLSWNHAARYRGDYRGNIDQMKLRKAIMEGLNRLSDRYDDLLWTGVIQVDTAHVHCHLCMVDAGKGRSHPSGRQRGKINARDRAVVRRGVDTALTRMEPLGMMTSAVKSDRQNVRAYVKDFASKMVAERSFPQFIVACLPDDRTLWRAGSKSRQMRKANEVTHEFVEGVLREPESRGRDVFRSIEAKAAKQRSLQGWSDAEYRRYVKRDRSRFVDSCVNAVYGSLKTLTPEELEITAPKMHKRKPVKLIHKKNDEIVLVRSQAEEPVMTGAMLHMMSMDYEALVAERLKHQHDDDEDLFEFGFRLRTYGARLNYHREQREQWYREVENYDRLQSRGGVSQSSQPLQALYSEEMTYHWGLMDKYRHFIRIPVSPHKYDRLMDDLNRRVNRIDSMQRMSRDPDIVSMNPDRAERYGRDRYGVTMGRILSGSHFDSFDRLIESQQDRLKRAEQEALFTVSGDGLVIAGSGVKSDSFRVESGVSYDFNMTRAFDLHHLRYDWSHDFKVGDDALTVFNEVTQHRLSVVDRAREYLMRSGQDDLVDTLPLRDVNHMVETARRYHVEPVYHATRPKSELIRSQVHTVSLDTNLKPVLTQSISSVVHQELGR